MKINSYSRVPAQKDRGTKAIQNPMHNKCGNACGRAAFPLPTCQYLGCSGFEQSQLHPHSLPAMETDFARSACIFNRVKRSHQTCPPAPNNQHHALPCLLPRSPLPVTLPPGNTSFSLQSPSNAPSHTQAARPHPRLARTRRAAQSRRWLMGGRARPCSTVGTAPNKEEEQEVWREPAAKVRAHIASIKKKGSQALGKDGKSKCTQEKRHGSSLLPVSTLLIDPVVCWRWAAQILQAQTTCFYDKLHFCMLYPALALGFISSLISSCLCLHLP